MHRQPMLHLLLLMLSLLAGPIGAESAKALMPAEDDLTLGAHHGAPPAALLSMRYRLELARVVSLADQPACLGSDDRGTPPALLASVAGHQASPGGQTGASLLYDLMSLQR
jgi:hypothetical protein